MNDLTLVELRQFSDAFAEDFFAAISLEATLDCHDVIGGTARAQVRAALTAARTRWSTTAPPEAHAIAHPEEAATGV